MRDRQLDGIADRFEFIGEARITFGVQFGFELRHVRTSFRGGLISRTLPLSATRPSGIMIRHAAPAFHSDSCQVSTQ